MKITKILSGTWLYDDQYETRVYSTKVEIDDNAIAIIEINSNLTDDHDFLIKFYNREYFSSYRDLNLNNEKLNKKLCHLVGREIKVQDTWNHSGILLKDLK